MDRAAGALGLDRRLVLGVHERLMNAIGLFDVDGSLVARLRYRRDVDDRRGSGASGEECSSLRGRDRGRRRHGGGGGRWRRSRTRRPCEEGSDGRARRPGGRLGRRRRCPCCHRRRVEGCRRRGGSLGIRGGRAGGRRLSTRGGYAGETAPSVRECVVDLRSRQLGDIVGRNPVRDLRDRAECQRNRCADTNCPNARQEQSTPHHADSRPTSGSDRSSGLQDDHNSLLFGPASRGPPYSESA
jgi:hypothetical protein